MSTTCLKKKNVKKDTQLMVYKPHCYFYFFFIFFFPFEIFWCIECKFVLVLRTFFFLKHKLYAGQILNYIQYLLKRPKIDQNDSNFFQSEIRIPWTKFLESSLVFKEPIVTF